MRRIFFSSSVILVSCILSLATSSTVSAAATYGDLIKASGPAVYYLAQDGKRYVFPTDKTYFTWYANFSTVKTISDSDLASYPLGGNVTYRPGVKLVKITTDPKVYAVDAGGALRWIQTESVAIILYGSGWTKNVDDIPDAFFINYKIGSLIASASDFSPTATANAAVTINTDKFGNIPVSNPPITTPPTSTTTPPPATNPYAISITLSKTTVAAGGTFTVQSSATPSASVQSIKISLNNVLQTGCEYRANCSTDLTIPNSGTLPQYDVRADVLWMDTHRESATATVAVGMDHLVTLTLHPEVRPNTPQELIADVDASFIAKYVDIYIDGGDMHGCNSVQQCRYLFTETGAIGTTHSLYAIAQDANGIKTKSPSKTYAIVANDHPTITFLPAKNTVNKGEALDINVTASDYDGLAWTEVWLDGTLLKHCVGSSCIVTAGPWSVARPLNFVGNAQDLLGLQASATSTGISVQ